MAKRRMRPNFAFLKKLGVDWWCFYTLAVCFGHSFLELDWYFVTLLIYSQTKNVHLCITTVRTSKHIYGKWQVKNVSEQSLMRITEVPLELFLFITSSILWLL